MARFVGVALLVLSSCNVPFEDYSRRYAMELCAREVRCGARTDDVDCARQLARPNVETWSEETRRGLKRFVPEEATRCLSLLESAPCTARPERTPTCQRAFEGALKEGDACVGGGAGHNTGCAPGLYCQSIGPSLCSACTRGTEGTRPCDYARGYGPSSGANCHRLPELGETCLVISNGAWCARGYACDARGTCAWPEKELLPCVVTIRPGDPGTSDCFDEPETPDLLPEAAACESNEACALGSCVEGQCRREWFVCE